MIQGVKLKQSKGNKMVNAILAGGSFFSSLPPKVATGLDAFFSKQTVKSRQNLIILLENKIRFEKHAYEKSKKMFGSTVNIELDGIILSHILEELGETVGIEIYPEGTYLVPFEEVGQIVKKLHLLLPNKDKSKNIQRKKNSGKNILFLVLAILVLLPTIPPLSRYAEIQYYRLKGNELFSKGKNEKSLVSYGKILEIDPNDVDAWIGKGLSYQALGTQSKAIEAFNKALEIKPDITTWYFKARAHYSFGEREKALNAYDKMLEIHPDDVDAWTGKGRVYTALGKKQEAFEAFEKALKIMPNNITWHNKGLVLNLFGEKEKALVAYDNALDFDSNYVRAWNSKGAVLFALGKKEQAIVAYNETLSRTEKICRQYRNSRCDEIRGEKFKAIGRIREIKATMQ